MGHSIRLYFIDALRAFAILMMLQGHFIDTVLAPGHKNHSNVIFNIWSYFRGITAPTFFTISGLVFTYLLLKAYSKGNDKPRIKKGLFRGLVLLGIGYSFRIDIFGWLRGDFNSYFFVIDVLQCIGISLILLIGLHCLFKKQSYILSFVLLIIGCLCFVTEPIYKDLTLDNIPKFIANYFTKSNGSVFTILPWFGYSVFGAFIATIFFRHVHRNRFKLFTVTSFFIIGYFLIYFSSSFLIKLNHLTAIDLFKMSAFNNYLFTRFGNVLILFGLFYAFERFLKHPIITRIGEKTLSIYVIHFILLYGSYTGHGLNTYFRKTLNPTQAIIWALIFIIVVCFFSFYYVKTNTFIYFHARRFYNKIKSNK